MNEFYDEHIYNCVKQKTSRGDKLKEFYRLKREEKLKNIFETPYQYLCLCNCGEITSPGKRYIRGHYFRVNKMKNKRLVEKKRKETFLKKYGVVCNIKRPGMVERVTKINIESGLYKRNCKLLNEWNHSDKSKKSREKRKTDGTYYRISKSLLNWQKTEDGIKHLEKIHEDPKRRKTVSECTKKWNNSIAGKEHIKSMFLVMTRNYPYKFLGVSFMSKEEMNCTKLLFEKFCFVPILGSNFQVNVGNSYIDFFFLGCFIEYHPKFTWSGKEISDDEYFYERRIILDKNGYTNDLVHIRNKNEFKRMVDFLCRSIGDYI